MINLDGTGRQELPLSNQDYAYGQILPAATGAGPPPFINVMQVPVPQVRSLGYKTAVKRITDANLTVGTVKRKYSSGIPKNHVVSQSPRGGAYAHRTTRAAPKVSLTRSRGPR